MELIIGSIPEADAYGGVIFSSDGKILLREPKDHVGGYAWTYAQGRPDPGETPHQAALRKALEETGLKCRILADIAQLFSGTTTSTAFFLMIAEGEPGEFNGQTSAICWATKEEARALIGQSPSEVARLRDLDILDHALILWHMDEGRYPHSYDPFNLQMVFEMVSILHGRGYEKLRIGPHENPSPYRLAVLPRKYFSVHHGAWVPSDGDSLFLSHSSELGGLVFRWIDADHDSPEQLADKYILRFPEEAAEGLGSDPAYAEWFQSLLDKTRRGGLPMTAIESLDYGPYRSPTLPISNPDDFWPDLTIPISPPGENENSPPPQYWTSSTGLRTGEYLAAESNYLGSPTVVLTIVRQIIDLSFKHFKGRIDFFTVWEDIHIEVLSLTFDDDLFGYTLDPNWHQPDGIGRALLKHFQLRPADDLADKMDYLWTEALMALFLKTRDLLIANTADEFATWDEQLPPPIAALHDWAVSVLLGTNVLFDADRVIGDFSWN
jgi:8-oxo-dGTP pyrophosphatase MutT (NUDIX family)